MIVHFGVKLREKMGGLKLRRENYITINKKSSLNNVRIYTDEECKKRVERYLKNYDLNMEYYSSLDHYEFTRELEKFAKEKKFMEVFDLNLYYQTEGYYIMVLDEYCQMYIGTTSNIKNRIMQHWSKLKHLID